MYVALRQNEESYAKFMEDKYANLENIDDSFGVDSEIAIDEEYEEGIDEEDYEEMYGIYDLQYSLNPSIYADMFLFEDSCSLAYGGIDDAERYSSLITALINGIPAAWGFVRYKFPFLKDKALWPLSIYLPNITLENADIAFTASAVTTKEGSKMLGCIFIYYGNVHNVVKSRRFYDYTKSQSR